MTTIYDFPFPGASPTGIDFGAFLLSHGGRCAPIVGYSPEASNGLLFFVVLFDPPVALATGGYLYGSPLGFF